MKDPIALAAWLDERRSGGAATLCLQHTDERSWPESEWAGALSSSEPFASVTGLELRALAWPAALVAELPRLFPSLETLVVDNGSLPVNTPAFSCEDLVEALWELPRLRRCDVSYLGNSGRELRLDGPPRFAATLEHLAFEPLGKRALPVFIARLGTLPALASLALGMVHDVSALAASCPALRTLTLHVDPKHTPRIELRNPSLESLTLLVKRRPATRRTELTGELPALRELRIGGHGYGAFVARPLADLVRSAAKSLRAVSLAGRDAWSLARAVAETLAEVSAEVRPSFAVTHGDLDHSGYGGSNGEYEAGDPRRESDWGALEGLLGAGFDVGTTGALALVDSRERFARVAEYLRANATELRLEGPRHAFLMEDTALLRGFDRVTYLHLFHTEGLTSDGLDALVRGLPRVESLRVVNNNDARFSRLRLKSDSLVTASFTHCHALQDYALDCPALRELELDNCDGEVIERHPDSKDPVTGDGCRCYGNLGERLARDLLGGSEKVRLPELRKLHVWHNHNSYGGPPPCYEELRVEIGCEEGHEKLEELVFSRCVHLRKLRLEKLPRLREVCVWDHPREEGDEGWFEGVESVGLDAGCVMKADVAVRKRVGLGLPA